MKTGFLTPFVIGIIGITTILIVILHIELLGEDATFGECIISASGNDGGYLSKSSLYENQCKQSCANAGSIEENEIRTVSCKFQTISGYGWITSPEEFDYMIDKLILDSLQ